MTNATECFIRLYEDLVDICRALESLIPCVGAVFVAASGKSTEQLQRLITPWDVPGGGGE